MQKRLAISLAFLFISFSSAAFSPDTTYKPVDLALHNQLTDEWLVLDEEQNELVPFVAGFHSERKALSQWVNIRPGEPFNISFTAKQNLSVFLDNHLVFVADSTANYQLNLSELVTEDGSKGEHLLSVWHPEGMPNINTFKNYKPDNDESPEDKGFVKRELRESFNQNTFILVLLFIGLIYGGLRVSYPTDFNNLFSINNFFRSSTLEDGFLSRPVASLSSILFIIAFSLSFSLLIVSIHTNVQNIFMFNRLFEVSEAAISAKVAFYTFVIFLFILFKYLFLRLLAYIFDLQALVSVQYREFIRTLLFLGIFLPPVMLLYLVLNNTMTDTMLVISNIAVSAVLIFTSIRIFHTVNNKVSLQNLHLFSYLCATEIIPLFVLLKLVVFSY